MKVKERAGAKKGSYVTVFKELIRPGNKVGLSIPKGEDKLPRMMFRLEDIETKAIEIACSTAWDPTDFRFKNTMGCLGVPLGKITQLIEEGTSEEKVLLLIERLATKAACELSTYVREDGGWGSIKPNTGVFVAKFARISSRNDEDLPIYTYIAPQTKSSKKGGTYDTLPINRFAVQFEVIAGDRTGALITENFHYAIVKDEDNDEWTIDAESRDGNKFNNLLILHKIPVHKINPDKNFADPDNGLPELEKMMRKRDISLLIEVKDGWVADLKAVPEGMTVLSSTGSVDDSEYKSALIGKLFAKIDKLVRTDVGKSAWLREGDLSPEGKDWVKDNVLPLMNNLGIPRSFKKLNDDQVRALNKALMSE